MKQVYINYLFTKHILVGKNSIDAFNNVLYLAKVYNIKIVKGKNLATNENVKTVADNIGINIPNPFYKGFPESVKQLSVFELLADQLVHYFNTYGLNDFSGESGHSIFEKEIEPKLFNEKTQPKEFSILTEIQAQEKLAEIVKNLCASSRPLNEMDFNIVREFILVDKHYDIIKEIKSKHTAVSLFYNAFNLNSLLRRKPTSKKQIINYLPVDDEFLSGISKVVQLPDTLKLLDIILSKDNSKTNKLNLRNHDRKCLSKFIDLQIEKLLAEYDNEIEETKKSSVLKECFEKRQLWKGLLHHLHYHSEITDIIFQNRENISDFSDFEKELKESAVDAAKFLKDTKGNGTLLRKLNYLISRSKTKDDVKKILKLIDTKNIIILIQLIIQYSHYDASKPRTFKFVSNKLQKVYKETKAEFKNRKSVIKLTWLSTIIECLEERLNKTLKNKINKVFIDPEMDNIGIPLQQTTSNGGFNVLPTGSIIKLPNSKIVRLFTYWEKVNDIDLSSIGINLDGSTEEFSWRSFYRKQSNGITFSGDVTNGYNGGSEYIDINIDEFKKQYPNMKYLVCCDNVFSGSGFNNCACKAGYMLRNKISSGEIFEPKTVQTSFAITGATNFNCMFALDLEKREIIWLNINLANMSIVAGDVDIHYLTNYFDLTNKFSVKKIFEKSATEIVDSVKDADIIVSDKNYKLSKNQEQIHSWDYEKIFKYLKK